MRVSATLRSMGAIMVGVLAGVPGCAPQRDDAPPDVTDAVGDIWKEYSASLNGGDLERWLALWTEDGVQMPPDEPAVIGKDRIRARNKAVLDQFSFDIDTHNEEAGMAGDWAFARGTYKATLKPKRGGDPIPIDGKYMSILSRQPDGSWKIHRDIFNSNVAAAR